MHMNKRILSLTLALVMILGTFTAVFAEVTTVEQKAAEFLRDNGVLEGDDKGDLLLDKKLERRDAVVLSARLLGEEEKAANTKFDEKTPSWTDVRTDKFYVPFFAWAETTGRFEGKGEGIFEPRAGLTTQEYATVLLRILGHELNGKDAWKSVMELAKKEGLLENVDAKADDILMRGNMAVMTLNALGATVKGTGKTLADELNIKLPVPAKLEVEDVYADNLKEVKVKFNKEIDAKLEDKTLFTLNKGVNVTAVDTKGDTLILTVENATDSKIGLKNKTDYTLTIKGTKEIDGKHDFKAYDNEVPYVVGVESLGTKAIKVTMSEPIKEANAKQFKLDGKSFLGRVKVHGREIMLTPYSSKLSVGEHELVVGALFDYANFKSVETLETFEVVEDTIAPEVVEVTGTLERVIVTFSEDVDEDSISRNTVYWNKKANKAKSFTRVSGNKYEFEFDSLPLYEVTLTIEGVKDYSGNKMTTVEMPFKGEIDDTRPEIVDVVAKEDANENLKLVEVKFNKEIYTKDNSHKTKSNYVIKNEKGIVQRIQDIEISSNGKVITLKLYNALEAGKEYEIKVDNLKDNTKLKNTMIPFEGKISLDKKASDAEFVSVVGKDNVIYVNFNKEMDLESVTNPDNYILTVDNNQVVLSKLDDFEINPYEGGKSVEIVLSDDYSTKTVTGKKVVTKVSVLSARDLDGKLIKNYNKPIDISIDDAALKSAKATSKTEVEVVFNQRIYNLSESALKIKGGSNTYLVEEVKSLDSKGKAVLTVEKLPANVEGFEVIVSDKSGIDALTGSVATTSVELEDAIAPSIEKVNAKLDSKALTLTITFDEEINVGEDKLAEDLKITNTNNVVLKDLSNVKNAAVANKKEAVIVISADRYDELVLSKFYANGVGYEVSVVKQANIKDNSDNYAAITADGKEVVSEDTIVISEEDVNAVKFNKAKSEKQAEINKLVLSEEDKKGKTGESITEAGNFLDSKKNEAQTKLNSAENLKDIEEIVLNVENILKEAKSKLKPISE